MTRASLIVENARIRTLDPTVPTARHWRSPTGRSWRSATGTRSPSSAGLNGDRRSAGAALVPGLVDSHQHPFLGRPAGARRRLHRGADAGRRARRPSKERAVATTGVGARLRTRLRGIRRGGYLRASDRRRGRRALRHSSPSSISTPRSRAPQRSPPRRSTGRAGSRRAPRSSASTAGRPESCASRRDLARARRRPAAHARSTARELPRHFRRMNAAVSRARTSCVARPSCSTRAVNSKGGAGSACGSSCPCTWSPT